MEKLARLDKLWFSLRHERAIGGNHGLRYWEIQCRDCGKLQRVRPGREDKVRKQLIRDGWDMGKRINLHTCPGCLEKVDKAVNGPRLDEPEPAPLAPPVPPEPVLPFLLEAWQDSSEAEREELRQHIALDTAINAAQAPRPSLQEVWTDASPEERDSIIAEVLRDHPIYSTLEQHWQDANWRERLQIMESYDLHHGHPLKEALNAAEPAELESLRDQILKSSWGASSLTLHWSQAGDVERKALLKWLEQSGLAFPEPPPTNNVVKFPERKHEPQTLSEHWNKSTSEERKELLDGVSLGFQKSGRYLILGRTPNPDELKALTSEVKPLRYTDLMMRGIFSDYSQLYKLIGQKGFPKPFKIKARDYWHAHEVDAWQAQQKADQTELQAIRDRRNKVTPAELPDTLTLTFDDDDEAIQRLARTLKNPDEL